MKLALFLSCSAMFLSSALMSGCSDDPAPEVPRLSRKGESCQLRSHCEDGLACVQQICVTSEFTISTTAKECAVIECSAPEDCCPTPDVSYCDQLRESCDEGNEYDCDYYQDFCVCNSSQYACENNTCKGSLTCPDGYCPSPYQCDSASHKCVECLDQGDCSSGQICQNNACIDKCTLDSDCPSFNRCQNGECVESGCLTDRECKAATKNALAVCLNGECSEPCQTNLECGSPETNFDFQACLGGQCVYVGCESDKECQLFRGILGNEDAQIVCRDKPVQ